VSYLFNQAHDNWKEHHIQPWLQISSGSTQMSTGTKGQINCKPNYAELMGKTAIATSKVPALRQIQCFGSSLYSHSTCSFSQPVVSIINSKVINK